MTDLQSLRARIARSFGATSRVGFLSEDPEALAPYAPDKGTFDVLFEASGNPRALRGALAVVRPGGVIVQLGLGGRLCRCRSMPSLPRNFGFAVLSVSTRSSPWRWL